MAGRPLPAAWPRTRSPGACRRPSGPRACWAAAAARRAGGSGLGLLVLHPRFGGVQLRLGHPGHGLQGLQVVERLPRGQRSRCRHRWGQGWLGAGGGGEGGGCCAPVGQRRWWWRHRPARLRREEGRRGLQHDGRVLGLRILAKLDHPCRGWRAASGYSAGGSRSVGDALPSGGGGRRHDAALPWRAVARA